jgi:4a-hydroxytetrahydrobiopterin dehydratase
MASVPPSLKISSNSSPAVIEEQLPPLLSNRWKITATQNGVEKEFKFKTFKATWAFLSSVAGEAQKARHHPEWSNVYNVAFIRWTTHHPAGLSELDLKMAKFCDEKAAENNEVIPAPSEQEPTTAEAFEGEDNGGMCSLTNRAVTAGGDCCVPKSAREQKKQGDDPVTAEQLHSKGP